MRNAPTDDYAFARAVRFADAQIRQWAIQTGRTYRSGAFSYKPEDLARERPDIDAPTNEDRSRAERIEFIMQPLVHGASYFAYLSALKPEHEAEAKCFGVGFRGAITTFSGDPLAFVTRITSFKPVVFGRRTVGEAGTFWAIGIDGRTYYGRHNGRGMYCRMRLSKWREEFDVEQRTAEGWEVVCSAHTRAEARADVRSYQENQPEYAVRIKRHKVKQT